MTETDIKLLPCPFCGTESVQGISGPEIKEYLCRKHGNKEFEGRGVFYTVCNNCGVQGPTGLELGNVYYSEFKSPDKAALAWNLRGEIYNIAKEAASKVASVISHAVFVSTCKRSSPGCLYRYTYLAQFGYVVFRDIFNDELPCSLDKMAMDHKVSIFVEEKDALDYCNFKNEIITNNQPSSTESLEGNK